MFEKIDCDDAEYLLVAYGSSATNMPEGCGYGPEQG